jgi:hypothetical protein
MSSRKIYNPKIILLKIFQSEQAIMSGVMINIKIFSRAEATSLFRLRTSVRPLILSRIESTFRVIRKDKLERMCKKLVVMCLKVFRQNLPGLTVEYQLKPHSEQLVCSPLDYGQ